MRYAYLLNYSVSGIKTLDKLISLSFYKKTISKELDMQDYNVKGIYGMNGSGKSAIVNSVEILRNLLADSDYLSNPIAQSNLDAIINKKTKELFIETDYITKNQNGIQYYRYSITLSKDLLGKYVISHEILLNKKYTSRSNKMFAIFEVTNGEIKFPFENEVSKFLEKKTMNLLLTASTSSLFFEKVLLQNRVSENIKGINDANEKKLYTSLVDSCIFGRQLYVYLDESDSHREYIAQKSLIRYLNGEEGESVVNDYLQLKDDYINVVNITQNVIPKSIYIEFEKTIDKLYEFLHIFKNDLQSIEIDKKENHEFWLCDLVMNYGNYKIHAEYESTGIKKLIKLFAYLKEMAQGAILFIDEFDSNLHDVYLCALLEYLMEYGEGQLCFTTHNVGPMDVLKHHKKSIEFLSENHKIYPWIKGGPYSPSKLYRNGMIEGSPFNIGSIDFIGVFSTNEGDE